MDRPEQSRPNPPTDDSESISVLTSARNLTLNQCSLTFFNHVATSGSEKLRAEASILQHIFAILLGFMSRILPFRFQRHIGTTGAQGHSTSSNSDFSDHGDINHVEREKTTVDLYSQLDNVSLGLGTALRYPQPNIRLSQEFRRKGLSIGNIGKITAERSFDFILDASLPASSPINPDNLYDDYRPIHPPFNGYDIIEQRIFDSQGIIMTPGVRKSRRDGLNPCPLVSFTSDVPEGAVLVMPRGAHLEKLVNSPQLLGYLGDNARKLYQYARDVRGRQVQNGELCVVLGCLKATCWGIATFKGVLPGSNFRLDLFERYEANIQNRSTTGRHIWDSCGASETQIGPEDENDDLLNGDTFSSLRLRNQTLFVDTTNIKLSENLWQSMIEGTQGAVQNDQEAVSRQSSESGSYPSSSSALLQSSSNATTSQDCNSSCTIYPGNFSQDMMIHNSGAVLVNEEGTKMVRRSPPTCPALECSRQRRLDLTMDYLLEQVPGATMAVSSDRDWASCDISSLKDSAEFISRVAAFNDVYEQNGVVYFEPKETLPSYEEQYRLREDLLSRMCSLQTFMYGSSEDRCEVLSHLIGDLQRCYTSPHQIIPESELAQLEGHPNRILHMDAIMQQPWALETHRIPTLRRNLHEASISRTNISISAQRLSESLLRRFRTLHQVQDLHEAVWMFSHTLTLTLPECHRHLEVLLDLCSALYYRFQLFRQKDDLDILIELLQQQKMGCQRYDWLQQTTQSLELNRFTSLPQILENHPSNGETQGGTSSVQSSIPSTSLSCTNNGFPYRIPSPYPRIFALLIGIDKYTESDSDSPGNTRGLTAVITRNVNASKSRPPFENLRGAVKDVNDFKSFLTTRLKVLEGQITTLYNQQATQSAILQALHQIGENSRIGYGDAIFIYFAGHATQSVSIQMHSNFTVHQEKTSVLLPYDYKNGVGQQEQRGISDYVLRGLIENISTKKGKNITVILDCCHSGSFLRQNKFTRSGNSGKGDMSARASNYTVHGCMKRHDTKHVPDNVNMSYVFLAACGASEMARETEQGRGRFSLALLHVLKTADLDRLNVEELMSSLAQMPNQHPRYEGKRDRLLFPVYNLNLVPDTGFPYTKLLPELKNHEPVNLYFFIYIRLVYLDVD